MVHCQSIHDLGHLSKLLERLPKPVLLPKATLPKLPVWRSHVNFFCRSRPARPVWLLCVLALSPRRLPRAPLHGSAPQAHADGILDSSTSHRNDARQARRRRYPKHHPAPLRWKNHPPHKTQPWTPPPATTSKRQQHHHHHHRALLLLPPLLAALQALQRDKRRTGHHHHSQRPHHIPPPPPPRPTPPPSASSPRSPDNPWCSSDCSPWTCPCYARSP